MKQRSRVNNNQNFKSTIICTMYMLKRCWKEKNGRKYIYIQVILSLLNIIPTIISIVIPGLIINELIQDKRIDTIVIYVAILIVIPFLHQIITSILTKITASFNLDLTVKLKKDFNDYVANMDYETLENPEIQTLRTRVRGTFIQPLNTANKVISLFVTVISFISIATIIASLNPLIVVVITIAVLANSLITKRLNYLQYLNGKEISRCDRALIPFQGILVHIIYAKEVRLFNLKGYFTDIISKKEQDINKYHLKDIHNRNIANIAYSVTNLLQQLFMYVYLICQILFYNLPIGSMTIYLNSISQFSSSLSSIINGYIGLSKDSLDIQEMIHFFRISKPVQESGTAVPIINCDSTIEFKNVYFKYPGTETFAINNLNLKIKLSDKICIVGENGAGKTTFVNLLTRLYSPTKGEILLNNRNIKEYDLTAYQCLFSPVLQDFCLYELPLSDNVILSNNKSTDRLACVFEKTGLNLFIDNLPKKEETTLGKMSDPQGVIPSGGEAQKIAIARALYRDAPIVILDEPTASLDPLSEHEIYTQFHRIIENKAAVLITHRLAAVQLSDKIVVFKNGHVVEYGTHSELYSKGGMYTEMFDKQAQFYRDNPAESNKE